MALGRTVEELLESLSAQELAEWIAFYQLEPWGFEADFYRSGIPAAVLANVHRDSKKRSKPYSPADFIPQLQTSAPQPRRINAPIMRAMIETAFVGRIRKKK